MRHLITVFCFIAAALEPLSSAAAQQQIPLRALISDLRITADDVPRTEIVSGITHVAVAPDGMIFSVDDREGRIRQHDGTGRFVFAFGRRGAGPEEFGGNIWLAGLRGDTVLVHGSDGRVLFFRRNGMYLTTQRVGKMPGDRVLVAYLTGQRTLVKIGHRPPGWIAPADSTSFTIADSLGNPLTRLALDPVRDERIVIGRGQPGVSIAGQYPQPFHFPVDAAADAAGLRAVVASQWTVWGGTPGQVKLAFTTGTGNPTERIVTLEPRRLTPALVTRWVTERLDARAQDLVRTGTPRGAAEAEMRRQLRSTEYLPVFDDIKLGADGAVWIRWFAGSIGPAAPGQPAEWVVVSPAGAIAFRVSVPAGVRVQQVSMDRMWAVAQDSDGLPVILGYRVSER